MTLALLVLLLELFFDSLLSGRFIVRASGNCCSAFVESASNFEHFSCSRVLK